MPRRDRDDTRHDLLKLDEAVGLAQAIDLVISQSHRVPLRRVAPGELFGSGQLQRFADDMVDEKPDLVIINAALSPVQQRNLERRLKTKVIDRTGLILEIFGRRAQTREGALQVELAHLTYQQGRLVRSWTHLERQRGGGGFLGGPGETQIETDRRLLRERIQSLKSRLEDVKRTRTLARRKRTRAPFPVVALVGYTNAGKSTLFNRMTKAEVLSKDMLFATLDPTVRKIVLPGGETAMLSDTVGFISNLPTELIAAFRATLEEVIHADLLLHVHDVSADDYDAQRADVLTVLKDLGVDPSIEDGPPIANVYNKIDCLSEEDKTAWQALARRRSNSHLTSAATGEGVDALLLAIEKSLPDITSHLHLEVPHANAAALGTAYRMGRNVSEVNATETSVLLEGDFTPQAQARLVQDGAILKN
ncbi:MAG: GTPase HflX [Pseudomonadota bacterium]